MPARPADELDGAGLLSGLGAYLLWGTFPLFFRLLERAGAVEIVAHRAVWSLVFCLALLAVTRGTASLRAVLRDRATVLRLALASHLVAVNWLTYVYAVNSGRTVDAALGYFINPVVTVLLGVVVLKERLGPLPRVAVGFGVAAVVVITVGYGQLPWIALTLAASFGLYGLVKNRAGRTAPALPGLAVETTALMPVAVGYLVWLGLSGEATFASAGTGHTALLLAAGPLTAVPLLLFATAARRLPLTVVGMLQYLTPVLQLLTGVLVFHEDMPAERWAGFVLVWVAIGLVTVDGFRALPRRRRS